MHTRENASWLSASVNALYAAQTVPDLVRAMMAAVDVQFNLVASSCEEVGMGGSTYVVHGLRCGNKPPADYAAYIHDNPLTPKPGSTRSAAVIHLRELTSMAEWSRTDHFNGIAQPTGFSDQLVLVAQTVPTTVGFGIYRDRMFSARECALAALLQPHVSAAWQRVRAGESIPTYAGPLRMTLSPGLRPLHLSAPVCQALKTYFPDWGGCGLPARVLRWATHSLAELKRELPTRPLNALAVESMRGRLLLRCFPESRGGLVQLFMVETPTVPNYFQLKRVGLTTRECEVLHWLAQGKRDAEIGIIMACATGTVSKHVEHILAKLAVGTRAAAVRQAHHYLRPGT